MAVHWIIYLASLAGCGIFYWAYREWFAWLAFVGVACCCVASLLISLPGMLRLRLRPDLPGVLSRGSPVSLRVKQLSRGVAPPYRLRMKLENCMTGKTVLVTDGQSLPTEHCCKLILRTKKARVYDYLGLFSLKLSVADASCLVMPLPVEIPEVPDLEQYIASSWRPKAGGGFSENHELREYRPGDNLNQVHWKLTAKTGQFIVREPMVPTERKVLVDLPLRGGPEEIDRKLGELMWLGGLLLDNGIVFEIRCLTGEGISRRRVENSGDLTGAIEWLLGQPLADQSEKMPGEAASWYYRIGGVENET